MVYQEYDDPYSFLAWYLISVSTAHEVQRILVDDEYLFHMMLKEVRGQDLCGPFTDCAVDEILRNKERMELMHKLDELAKFLFKKLDLPRLRHKILEYAEAYSII